MRIVLLLISCCVLVVATVGTGLRSFRARVAVGKKPSISNKSVEAGKAPPTASEIAEDFMRAPDYLLEDVIKLHAGTEVGAAALRIFAHRVADYNAPLHLAMCLKHGLDEDWKPEGGETVREKVARSGHIDCIRTLDSFRGLRSSGFKGFLVRP